MNDHIRRLRNLTTGRSAFWKRLAATSVDTFENGVVEIPDPMLQRSIRVVLSCGLQMVETLVDQGEVSARVVLGASPFDVKRVDFHSLLYVQMRFLAYWTYTLRRLSPGSP